jgi:hypothetical protein
VFLNSSFKYLSASKETHFYLFLMRRRLYCDVTPIVFYQVRAVAIYIERNKESLCLLVEDQGKKEVPE